MRNSILGMASHDLSNTKTTILGATPGVILRIDGHPHERFSFVPEFSERFLKNWGGRNAQHKLSGVAILDTGLQHQNNVGVGNLSALLQLQLFTIYIPILATFPIKTKSLDPSLLAYCNRNSKMPLS